jgi:hypothetical protein
MHDVLDKCRYTALEHINWFLKAEDSVSTLNEHYYSDYKNKFLAYHRSPPQHWSQYEDHSGVRDYVRAPSSLSMVISGLNQMGIHDVRRADIPKLLPSLPYQPALLIMAGVRGYVQGRTIFSRLLLFHEN